MDFKFVIFDTTQIENLTLKTNDTAPLNNINQKFII